MSATKLSCPQCGRLDGRRHRLPYHDEAVCWDCHCRRLGGDGAVSILEPESDPGDLLGVDALEAVSLIGEAGL